MIDRNRRELRLVLDIRGGQVIEYVNQPTTESDEAFEQRAITVLAAMLERSTPKKGTPAP